MFALDALVLIISGFFLLRIAGKKVISEMTPLEMVTTLAIGTIIGHVDAHSRLLRTVVTIGLFITILIVFQYIAMKWPFFQKLIIGKPTLVIKDGQLLQQNLAKLRMTTEQLELRVRQQGITNISDIKTATLEVNGQLGYELTKSASPITHKEWEQLLKALNVELEKEEPKNDSVFEKVRKNAE